MKVILRQSVERLGQIGDVLEVKDGYARNFLLPRNLAFTALKGNLATLEEEKKTVRKKISKEIAAAEKIASELEKVSITIPIQVGEEDKIFGTVTNQMIADSLKEKGFDIDKRRIEIEEQIKSLGIYSVNVKLHQSVNAKIKVWVVRE